MRRDKALFTDMSTAFIYRKKSKGRGGSILIPWSPTILDNSVEPYPANEDRLKLPETEIGLQWLAIQPTDIMA